MTAHREPFAFTALCFHCPCSGGVNGQLKSGGGVVGTSEDDLESGSKNRANLVALFRLLHAHVVQQDVAGNDSSIASSAACPRSVPELVSVAELTTQFYMRLFAPSWVGTQTNHWSRASTHAGGIYDRHAESLSLLTFGTGVNLPLTFAYVPFSGRSPRLGHRSN